VELLVPNLLDGRTVALAGGVRPAVEAGLSGLGARLVAVAAEEPDPEAWAAEHAPIHALVYDAAASFGAGGDTRLRGAVDGGWSAIHTVATAAFIPAAQGATIVLLTPPAGAGPRAAAVRAALENTARTLSIEWARFGITTTAITPGAGTSDEEIATLIAFLVSPAGGYFSGCRFDLGTVG
jgi:NAD(P)-dependent dehydrogenase (short-subunit alcohol dehydrogenase family)